MRHSNVRPASGWPLPCWLFTALFLALGLGGCQDAPQQRQAPPPPTVSFSTPLSKAMTEWDEYTGRFAAIEDVEIRARVSGYLDSIHFRDGDQVEKGQLLFIIDPRPFEVALMRAEAELKQAQTSLVLASKELERARPLLKSKAIPEQTFDERLQAKREAEAQVAAAKASVDAARLDLEFTSVTAPVSGQISQREVTVGNLVRGGNQDATLLTTIVSHDPIYFYFDVGELDYLKYMRLWQADDYPGAQGGPIPVYVSLADENGFAHRGRLNFVDNRMDMGTGTMRGRAVFTNDSGLFVPGLFARIRIPGSARRQTMLVPEEAIQSDQSRKFVFVLGQDNTVQYRPVGTGKLVDTFRVVRSGLQPTDKIALDNFMRLRPNMPVTPKDTPLDDTALNLLPEPEQPTGAKDVQP